MTLDPTIAALLKAAAHLPKVSELPVEVARKGFRARLAALPAATDPLAGVENLQLPAPDGRPTIPARLYRPTGDGGQSMPLLLYFHGGGFVLGDLDTHDGLCRRLCARSGSEVLAVDYRLAPEHPYPAALEDCRTALLWAQNHAGARGLALAGDSAGGTLAAATALSNRDRGKATIRALLLFYPMLDHPGANPPSYTQMAEGYGLTRDSMLYFIAQYLTRPEHLQDGYALPLRATSHAGLPPTLAITAHYDVLRDEAETYARALSAAGVESRLIRYADMNHGFMSLGGLVPVADAAIAAACTWLRDHAAAASIE